MDPEESDPNLPTKDENFRLRAVDWALNFHHERHHSTNTDVLVLANLVYEFFTKNSNHNERTVQ